MKVISLKTAFFIFLFKNDNLFVVAWQPNFDVPLFVGLHAIVGAPYITGCAFLWVNHVSPANFICMEWDGGPVTIQSSRVFAKGVSHEIREDGYYYVPMNIRNQLMQYAEQFDDPSGSDGEGLTHEDREPEYDPQPPASSSSSSSRKPAPKGPRGVTSKTRVSPPNHRPARAAVV